MIKVPEVYIHYIVNHHIEKGRGERGGDGEGEEEGRGRGEKGRRGRGRGEKGMKREGGEEGRRRRRYVCCNVSLSLQ